VSYFDENKSFEKPYGWAWFLRLVVELELLDHPQTDEWRSTLRPMENMIVSLVVSEFLTQDFPIRSGLHRNSAYALQSVLDYARIVNAEALESSAKQKTLDFYLEDQDYPIQYEPISWDTISPSLTEADLMRRVLTNQEFGDWFDEFLPFESPHFTSFLEPHTFDLESAHAGELHLAGLNLSKAWCLADISTSLGDGERAESLWRGAERHAETGLDQAFTEDYAGSHWLISFVLYLLSRNDGGIAPAGA